MQDPYYLYVNECHRYQAASDYETKKNDTPQRSILKVKPHSKQAHTHNKILTYITFVIIYSVFYLSLIAVINAAA